MSAFPPFFWDSNDHHGLIDSQERWDEAIADVATSRGEPTDHAERWMLQARARPLGKATDVPGFGYRGEHKEAQTLAQFLGAYGRG